MNDLDYKTTVLDAVSPSFCAAKWYNATIWLGSGQTTSCHHPPAHAIDPGAVVTNPRALHNTDQKKADRADMLAGRRPQGCEYCWRIEDMALDPAYTGTTPISDRVYKSKIYPIQALHHAQQTPPESDVALRTLEIAFDRTCQLACSYCNPAFSSSWVKDIKNNGPYHDLRSDGRNHFTHTHESSQLYRYGETNPYVEAFFAWWNSELHHTLQELRITGGEPLMSAHTWRLIDWFKHNRGKSATRLAINSNLGPDTDVPRLLAATAGMGIDVYTSCEATGAGAEYIRSGLNWDSWVNNVETVLNNTVLDDSHRSVRALHIMSTINALCLTTLDQFLEQVVAWKKQYGPESVSFTLNILRFPSFQSAVILPDDLRMRYRDQLAQFLVRHRGHSYLHEHEINHCLRLIDYLDIVKTPHSDSADVATLRKDFGSFYRQYDARRGLDFESTFPELADWYATLASGAV